MGLGDPTTCVYQFILDKYESNGTKTIQYFVLHGIWLYIKLNSYVSHMFYSWSLIHSKAVPNCYQPEQM